MKRRNFLSLIGAATVAPALPPFGAPSGVAAAGYNRYMYGLAVFQARTRVAINATDLTARLGVTLAQANAMMWEMKASGVLSAVTGAVQAPHLAPRPPYVRKAIRLLRDAGQQALETSDSRPATQRLPMSDGQAVPAARQLDPNTPHTTIGDSKSGVQ